MLQTLPKLVNQRPALVRRGRFLTVDFRLSIGDQPYDITIDQGHISRFQSDGGLLRSWQFRIAAPAATWLAFWQPIPAPGFHDIFALNKSGLARLEGDLYPFMSNLRYFKEVIAIPREFHFTAEQDFMS